VYKVITQANTVPVSNTELTTHLQLWGDDSYDSEIEPILFTAQEIVSDRLGEFVSNTVIQMPMSDFSDVELVHQNTSDITVSYYDANNALQVLNANNYVIDSTGKNTKICFENTPTVSSDYQYPAFVQYSTGYQVVPRMIKHAILLTAAELFEVRSETTEKARVQAQLCVQRLLQSKKRVVV
jgi:uncharacterized phiE125 gp8 family phage protein